MLALEVGYGAGVGAVLLFLGYEVGFRVLPGWLLYRVLATRPGGALRQLALGWAIGSALEIFAFIATAAMDIRPVFTVYPLIVGIPAAVLLLRRRRSGTAAEADWEAPVTAGFAWALAGVCLLAMGLLAITYFPTGPLPDSGSISYFRDYTWHLGLAGEAKHHWPIQDPNVSGEPLPYHYFVHFHMAAASQVTGLDLPLVFFRLFNLPLVLLSVLLYVTAGRSLGRNAWVGLLAAGLALLIGDLQMQTSQEFVPHVPFLGVFVTFLITSPSFLYGLPMFLALLVLVGERVASNERGSLGDWIVIAILAVGATNAKVAILPLIVGALGLYGAWRLLNERRFPFPVLTAGVITGVAMGLTYLSQYAGHSSGVELGPFDTFDQMPVVGSMKGYLGGLVSFPLESTVLTIGGVVLGTIGLFGPQLAGVAWIGALRARYGIRREQVWLITLQVGGMLAMFLLAAPGTGNQLYFVFYGIAAGWLVAADGFRLAWEARPPMGASRGRIATICAGWLVLLVVVMRAPLALDLFSGADAASQLYTFWYAGLAVSLVILLLAVRKFIVPAGWWAGALAASALLLVGAIGTVSNYVVPSLTPASTDASASTAPDALTPDAYAALSWVRNHTPVDAVLAANNSDPFNFEYAAFAERDVFLEGWAYTRKSFDTGYDLVLAGQSEELFKDRFQLNADAFAGDPEALATLVDDYGVRYLIVDSAGGIDVNSRRLMGPTTPVYETPGMQVLEIDDAPGA